MCEKKDGLIVVPASYDASKPTALLLALHGATGTPEHQLGLYRPMSSRNVILVVPASRLYTWDLIVSRGQYGPDVAFLNHLLFRVFSTYNVDPEKLAIGGFSDGASYAASLGMSNGELFKNLLINSPGFAAPLSMLGKPRIFVSHGTEDKVLPIANCSRRLVPMLKQAGYPTEYVEFRGGHELKRDILQKMLAWWLDESKSSI